jgi:hypothetical protein
LCPESEIPDQACSCEGDGSCRKARNGADTLDNVASRTPGIPSRGCCDEREKLYPDHRVFVLALAFDPDLDRDELAGARSHEIALALQYHAAIDGDERRDSGW